MEERERGERMRFFFSSFFPVWQKSDIEEEAHFLSSVGSEVDGRIS